MINKDQVEILTEMDFGRELEKISAEHPTIILEAPILNLFMIIGALQLALRHPAFPETSRQAIDKFIEQAQAGIGQLSPKLARLIDLGFDEKFDR